MGNEKSDLEQTVFEALVHHLNTGLIIGGLTTAVTEEILDNQELDLPKEVVLDILGKEPKQAMFSSKGSRDKLAEKLAERSREINFATRRKQHMMECTHPVAARNADIEDALWYCTSCGYYKKYDPEDLAWSLPEDMETGVDLANGEDETVAYVSRYQKDPAEIPIKKLVDYEIVTWEFDVQRFSMMGKIVLDLKNPDFLEPMKTDNLNDFFDHIEATIEWRRRPVHFKTLDGTETYTQVEFWSKGDYNFLDSEKFQEKYIDGVDN